MPLLRQLTRGFRALVRRHAADREIADEVDHYLEETTAAYQAQGLAPADARRAARRDLGSQAAVQEQMRGTGWEHALETTFADLRHGGRRLRHNPGFTLVATVTLALGVAASTAIFSAVKPILIDALPYPRADRLAMIWDAGAGRRNDVTFGTFREVAARSRSFQALAVMAAWQPSLAGSAEPQRLDGQRVSSDYFRVLAMAPALGRDFQPADDTPDAAPVAVISDGLWRRLGGMPELVGQFVKLDGANVTVIGVMPRSFENVLSPSAEIWRPLRYDHTLPATGPEWGHHLRMVGRIRPGVAADAAHQELSALARTPISSVARPPWANLRDGFLVVPLQDEMTREVKPALAAVVTASLLLLAIACVNVVNLVLARGIERRAEFATRAALGASRGRLLRQLLAEALVLAGLGGTLGLALAHAAVVTIIALSPPDLPRLGAIRVDSAAFVFAAVLSVGIGLIVTIVPGVYALAGAAPAASSQAARIVSGHQRARRILVVAEVALALVLLVGAGLLVRTVRHLLAVAPGFRPEGVLTLQVQATGEQFRNNAATRRFFAQALDAVRQLPGVSAAAMTTQLPLTGDAEMWGVHLQSSPTQAGGGDRSALVYTITPEYLNVMGISLQRGRVINDRDTASAPLAVLLSASFAQRRFPGQNPIGQRLHIGPDTGPWFTVVGVVGDVKQASLAVAPADAVYVADAQWALPARAMWFTVRTAGAPAPLVPAIRRAIWSVDKTLPIVRVATMNERVNASTIEQQFVMVLFEAFAGIALVLATIGIYGILAGSVAERTREIGLRSALGATRASILGMVLRQALIVTGTGLAVGTLIAAGASRGLETMLFGVSRGDTLTYGAVIALLIAASLLGCCVPGWRAVRIDPSVALRT
jgi:putative ABC transport system permease protein